MILIPETDVRSSATYVWSTTNFDSRCILLQFPVTGSPWSVSNDLLGPHCQHSLIYFCHDRIQTAEGALWIGLGIGWCRDYQFRLWVISQYHGVLCLPRGAESPSTEERTYRAAFDWRARLAHSVWGNTKHVYHQVQRGSIVAQFQRLDWYKIFLLRLEQQKDVIDLRSE